MQAPSLGQPEQSPKPDLGALRGKTVLVVDDEADIRSLVAMMLEGQGVRSITTDSADSAVETLNQRQGDIALILLDLSVPNSSELPVVDRLRREQPSVPIIVMTGMAGGEGGSEGSGGTMVGYLRKPFRPAALYDALAQRGRMADTTRPRPRRPSGGRGGDRVRFRIP